MKQINDKLDKLDARLDTIEITLTKQEANIEHHIERTDRLQEMVEPIYKMRLQMIGVVKLLGFLTLIGSLIKLFLTVIK